MIQFLVLAAILVEAPASPRDAGRDPRAESVFERTKRTRATYSLYSWNWVRNADGSLLQDWSAEFHSGSLHRVETPTARLVADCAAQDGTMVDLQRNQRVSGATVAGVACGINSNFPIVAMSLLGRLRSRFGLVDKLRVEDAEDERIYIVDRRGILVASEIFSLHGMHCLQSEPIAVTNRMPRGDIFSVRSLERSVVAERFRRRPARPVGDLWSPGRRCAES